MSRPQINRIKPFDATKDAIVTMSYVGNYPKRNRVIIYDAITMLVIYDNTTTMGKFEIEHTIPANTLKNGKKYAMRSRKICKSKRKRALSNKYAHGFW